MRDEHSAMAGCEFTIDMGETSTPMEWIVAGAFLVMIVVQLVTLAVCYRKPGPEEAIVRTGVGGLSVATGRGVLVVPILQQAQRLDLSVKRLVIEREGRNGLVCKDGIRADIRVEFHIRVNSLREDIQRVVELVGPQRAAEIGTLQELFEGRFSEILSAIASQHHFAELFSNRFIFRDEILKLVGTDLDGYRIESCSIEYLDRT